MVVTVTKKPKVRTVAKERYLKAKAKRRKARLAKKAEKKKPVHVGNEVDGAGGDDDAGDGEDEESERDVEQPEPESSLAPLTAPNVSGVNAVDEGEKKKKKKKRKGASDEGETAVPPTEATANGSDVLKRQKTSGDSVSQPSEGGEGTEEPKKRRKKKSLPASDVEMEQQEDQQKEPEKKRKKRKSDATPAQEQPAEDEVGNRKKKKRKPDAVPPDDEDVNDTVMKKAKKKKPAPPPEDSDEEAAVSEPDSDAAPPADDPADPDAPMRSPTPPFLPSFPLPQAPPPPSAAELSRQGLDRALLKATLVPSSLTVPLSSPDANLGLSERMHRRLHSLGVENLFAVQAALWPWFLSSEDSRKGLYEPYDPPRDVCVSAPTGSGKTLAYAVPIVEILSQRIITRLRALIILPTRDLVQQVRETFEALCKGTGLRVGSATGAQSFAREQRQLVADMETKLQGGSSMIDILICTPGRLIDHLEDTPNFSLQHLRFLVIDEADRLLTQSFQSFLPQVLAAITPPDPRLPPKPATNAEGKLVADNLAPAWMDIPRSWGEPEAEPSCQKLLFSATMTRDPGILKSLNLRDPKYFIVTGAKDGEDAIVREEFTVPDTLSEHLLVVPSDLKPLYLFHLLRTQPLTNVLIFTKSADSTTRLMRLLEFFESAYSSHGPQQAVTARAYSSELAPSERRSILERFKKSEIGVLVASDLISRGIDIPQVSHVVNYDIPLDMRKYVHRAGRTARAGRQGDVWTLVEEQEARFFREMLKGAGHWKRVKRMRLEESVLEPLRPYYTVALEKLREVYSKKGPEA